MYTTQTCSIFFDNFNFPLHTLVEEWPIDETLISISFAGVHKGLVKLNQSKFFLNTCTLILKIWPNLHYTINVKLSRNGTVQLTGCRQKQDSFAIFEWIWNKFNKPDVNVTIVWSMTNFNKALTTAFSEKDLIEKLKTAPFDHVLINTAAYCYSGIFFKVLISDREFEEQEILRIYCLNKTFEIKPDKFINFVKQFNETKQNKKLRRHYITFTIFHSGKCNVSGIGPEITENKINQVLSYLDGQT